MAFKALTGSSLWTAAFLAAAALPLAGCEDSLLEFDDPDIIIDASSAAGAIALKNGTVQRFNNATVSGTSDAASLVLFSGLLADEWKSGDTFEQRNQTDQRAIVPENTFLTGQLLNLNRVRFQAQAAIRGLRQFAPTPESNIGLMFALTGFMENLAGEVYCNGLVFSEQDASGTILEGSPITVDSAFKRAIASSDSALRFITGTGGTTVRDFALVTKARALLNLNRTAEAATAVAGVATGFTYDVTHSTNTQVNMLWSLNAGQRRYVVADRDGGTGLPFISANDPRLPVVNEGRLAFDSQTPSFIQTRWGQFDAVSLVNGIEARLIEAEAALKAGDVTTWLAKLNTARATRAGLAPLTDPGTPAARVDLMFSERGFWMFGTGHRLGDMRRLIRHYGRSANTVFPTGVFHKGGPYGSDVNVPITIDELNNKNFTGCLDRNA
jgi:starch-binding outer membrane protein, SusD/RagB family